VHPLPETLRKGARKPGRESMNLRVDGRGRVGDSREEGKYNMYQIRNLSSGMREYKRQNKKKWLGGGQWGP